MARAATLTPLTTQPRVETWFSRLGLPLSADDLQAARAYLALLGYDAGLAIVAVTDWEEAERVARAPDWDAAWWEGEDSERGRLKAEAERRHDAAFVLGRLTSSMDQTGDAIHAAAIVARARTAGTDAMVSVASGAAAMAAHEAALASLAGCGPNHLFMRKYALFESGRWPLGVRRGAFYLF